MRELCATFLDVTANWTNSTELQRVKPYLQAPKARDMFGFYRLNLGDVFLKVVDKV
jgi:hypothetical protein